MTKELRLHWEPENTTPLAEIEDRLNSYTKGRGDITVLGNGTLLSLTESDDPVADAKQALNEARFIVDFRVVPLKEGGFMVAFHKAVAVFVGEAEFSNRKVEIEARQAELRFPGETLISPPGTPSDHTLIGLYARGKLQYDAYHFNFYKKL
jgi:hypothetical protein